MFKSPLSTGSVIFARIQGYRAEPAQFPEDLRLSSGRLNVIHYFGWLNNEAARLHMSRWHRLKNKRMLHLDMKLRIDSA